MTLKEETFDKNMYNHIKITGLTGYNILLLYCTVRRRTTPGDAHLAEIGGGRAAGGPCRGFRRLCCNRRDCFIRSVYVFSARRQTPGKAASQQPITTKCD